MIFFILILVFSSFAITYADDEDDGPGEIKNVEELEVLLEEAESQEDAKLVRKINKHIKRLNWKAAMESWKAEKQEIIELKDELEQELDDAIENGNTVLAQELKDEIKEKIEEFKNIKNQAHKNGNGKRKLNPSVQNQIDNHQNKIDRFETKLKEAELNGDEKQIKRIEKQLEKFMQIEMKKTEKKNKSWKFK